MTKQPGVSRLDPSKGQRIESEAKEMAVRLIRVLALVLLLCVVAAQVHFCVESSAARSTRHQCQVCKSGGWAEASPDLNLDARLACNPLQEMPATRGTLHQGIEASSSRAPPQS